MPECRFFRILDELESLAHIFGEADEKCFFNPFANDDEVEEADTIKFLLKNQIAKTI